jgi:hypothetical protein
MQACSRSNPAGSNSPTAAILRLNTPNTPFSEHLYLVATRVVRAAVPAVANTVAVAVAIHAIRHPITVTVPLMHTGISVRNFVSKTTGHETTDGD